MNFKTVEVDITKNPLSRDIVSILNQNNKVDRAYFFPTKILNSLIKFANDNNLNNDKFYNEMFQTISYMLSTKNNFSNELKLISDRTGYIKNIRTLEELDIIIGKESYETGTKPFNYIIDVDDTSYSYIFFDNDIKNTDPSDSNIKVKLDDNYKNTIMNADIYITEAIFAEYNYIIGKYKELNVRVFTSRINKIFRFAYDKKRTIKKGNTVNRLFSSFSELTKISRKFVHMDGKLFNEIDLKNSQPVILAQYLNDLYDIDENFIEDTKNGLFYEAIMNKAKELDLKTNTIFGKDGEITFNIFTDSSVKEEIDLVRIEVKKFIMRCIIFYQHKNSNIYKIFSELYPKTIECIQREHSMTDNSLAGLLQNKEADIFLNIKPNCSYFTVHDAIYYTDLNQEEYILNKIEELFGNSNYTIDPVYCDNKILDVKIDFEEESNTRVFIIEKYKYTHKKHKQHKPSIKSLQNIENVKELYAKGIKQAQIGRDLGLSKSLIHKIVKENIKNK